MDYIKKVLLDAGLEDLEIEVYLNLLKTGEASVSTIARKIGSKRTNIYNVAEKLSQKGFLSEISKSNVKYFSAMDPKKILYSQKQQKDIVEKNIHNLEEILPQLESLKDPYALKPRVSFYQGKEAIGNLLIQTLEEPFDAYFNPDEAYNLFPKSIEDFQKHSAKKNLFIRELLTYGPLSKKYIKEIKNPNHKCKILSKKYSFFTDNFIFHDKIIFISYRTLIAVIIENEDIANTQKQAFEIMWNSCS